MLRAVLRVAVALFAAPILAQHGGWPPLPDSISPLEPASTGGVELVDRALARLATHKRLLVIGAHPDDEDNALLAHVSRGLGGEAAYLSLSRGEGGQNLIGPELGVELGAIRTGELLAARRVEGTRQFFARAFDFGYTRSLDETFSRWPREVLQEDAVRAVRRFMPQVVVAIFPADERAGHGQHQASAVLAADAVELAGSPDRFPRLTAEGLAPWQPQALFRRAWSRDEASVSFDLGVIDPLLGLSVGQIAARSRSRHRSQDMGRIEPLGRGAGGVIRIDGAAAGGAEIFSGIDTRLAAIAESLPEGSVKRRVSVLLDEVERSARRIRHNLAPVDLSPAAAPIAEIIRSLDEAMARAGAPTSARSSAAAVVELLREKRGVAARALAAAAGIALDAVADREALAPGDRLRVTTSVWVPASEVVEERSMRLELPAGWTAVPGARAEGELDDSGVWRQAFEVGVASEAPPTVPYYLERAARTELDLYDWSGVPAATRGLAHGPPPITAVFELRVENVDLEFRREVVFRYGDQALGEVRRPLRVVPELEAEVSPSLVLLKSTNRGPENASLDVVLRSNVEKPVRGRLRLLLPSSWPSPESAFEIDGARGSTSLVLVVEPPGGTGAGSYEAAVGVVSDGETARAGGGGPGAAVAVPLVEYPHIRPTPVPRPASASIRVLEVELPDLHLVGYVPGASDRVPEVLSRLGIPIRLLTRAEIEHGDLDSFDAIVIGSRAYETDAALRRANARLLDYARRGGTLLVQYQQYQFIRGGFAPFPFEIDRPHGRVTDETAPVRLLVPDHRLFHRPNRLTGQDWEGWVQERGLYFAGTWDERYTPLLAMADAGRREERGALLIAPLGKGIYIYTGLSFFRELPAGVPGAVRLFLNLLALRGGQDAGS